jgi:curved DNA-binding protein CbpA
MLRRQMELHPDKYSGNEKEVTLARELSGRINGAYEILRDPLKRAEYLVRLLPRYHVNDKADTASCRPVNLKSQRLNR